MNRLPLLLSFLSCALHAQSIDVPPRFVLKGELLFNGDAATPTTLHIGNINDLSLRLAKDDVTLFLNQKSIGAVTWSKPLPVSAPFALIVSPDTLSFASPGAAEGHWEIPRLKESKLNVEEGDFAKLTKLRMQSATAISFSDDFMRSDSTKDEWVKVTGNWTLDRIPNPTWSVSPFRYRCDGEGGHLASAGYWFWNNYVLRCAVRPGASTGGAGIAALVADAENCVLFRWQNEMPLDPRRADGSLQLVQLIDGKEFILAEKKGQFDPSQWYEFSLALAGQNVYALIDGFEIFQGRLNEDGKGHWPLGKVGLWASNADGALFDDVEVKSVSSLRLDDSAAELRSLFGPRKVIVPQVFATDSYMKGWASTAGEWSSRSKGLGQLLWRIGSFGQEMTVNWPLNWTRGHGRQPVHIAMAADGYDLTTGYHVQMLHELEFFRQGKSLGKAALPEQVHSFEWRRQNGHHRLLVNDEAVATFKDPDPLAGGKVGMYLPASTGIILDTNKIQIHAAGQQDYTFSTAPADWRVASGAWDITSRWVCTPKWSWFGGKSHETATIWSKRSYHGDQVVDLTTAIMMDYGAQTGYRKVGDLNISFCADGQNLSSGYTLMYGGFNNTKTCLWRKDKIVAYRTDRTFPMPAGGMDMLAHKSWFNVKAEKKGDMIRFFLGNELILEYRDSEPLEGGHVAAWTWDGGMMVPRIRIFAERLGETQPPFLASLNSRQARSDEFGAFKIETKQNEKTSITFVNPQSGGDFTSPLGLDAFDGLTQGRIKFDYRIPQDVRLHLYLQANGHDFYLAVNAPENPATHEFRETVIISGRQTRKLNVTGTLRRPARLGSMPVLSDGQWHSADVDLSVALRQHFPRATKVEITHVRFANWCDEGYLMSGFGGNPVGASFSISDIRFLETKATPSRTPGRFEPGDDYAADTGMWQSLEDATAKMSLQKIDGRDCLQITAANLPFQAALTTAPFDIFRYPMLAVTAKAGAGTSAYLKCLAGGQWHTLHIIPPDAHWHIMDISLLPIAGKLGGELPLVQALIIEGAARPTASEASVFVDEWHLNESKFPAENVSPEVDQMQPGEGERAAPESVRFFVRDLGCGVDTASIALLMNGKRYTVTSTGVNFSPLTGLFTLNLREPFADKQKVTCKVEANDRLGNRIKGETSWSWTFDFAEDRIPPGAPYVTYVPSEKLAWNDFEESLGECISRRGGGSIRTSENSATGDYCVQTSGYSSFLTFTPYEVRKYPIVRFDYRLPIGSQTNLLVRMENVNWSIGLAGDSVSTPTSTPLANLDGIRADGSWHQAEINLLELFESEGKALENFTVDHIATMSGRRRFMAASASGWFDNFCVSSRTETNPSFEWSRPRDATGIAGYSVLLDSNPATVPDDKLNTRETRISFKELKAGDYYLHVRACDTAGNWGQTGHRKVEVGVTRNAY
ncbi:MAG: hypothetical protein O2857_01635 [Planctomycetota bacterium]|nr:hypothetical protein [Planctomycetota bacterium]